MHLTLPVCALNDLQMHFLLVHSLVLLHCALMFVNVMSDLIVGTTPFTQDQHYFSVCWKLPINQQLVYSDHELIIINKKIRS